MLISTSIFKLKSKRSLDEYWFIASTQFRNPSGKRQGNYHKKGERGKDGRTSGPNTYILASIPRSFTRTSTLSSKIGLSGKRKWGEKLGVFSAKVKETIAELASSMQAVLIQIPSASLPTPMPTGPPFARDP